VGPGGTEQRFVDWTETVMKGWKARQWSWDMEGLSLHNYTVINWEKKHSSVDFGEKEYAEILKKTLEINALLDTHIGIMDKYDPEKKIAMIVVKMGERYCIVIADASGIFCNVMKNKKSAVVPNNPRSKRSL